MSRDYILTAYIRDADDGRNEEELIDVIESMDTPRGLKLGKYELVDIGTKKIVVSRP